MIITICASLSFFKKSLSVKKELETLGHTVYWPLGMERELKKLPRLTNHGRTIRIHYEKIKKSDAILVVNEAKNGIKNYIGGNVLMEIGFAFVLKKKIYLLNPIPKVSYTEEIVAMQPVVLDENLKTLST